MARRAPASRSRGSSIRAVIQRRISLRSFSSSGCTMAETGCPDRKILRALHGSGLGAENSINRLQLNILSGFARAALLGEPG